MIEPKQAARDVSATISRLFIYPVKSCAGVELREAVLTETGLDLDRAWMVVDAQGEFVTQREYPRLALVKPQLKTNDIVLRAPGMMGLHLMIDAVEQPVQVRVWGDVVSAYDMGEVAAQWFSDYLSLAESGLPTPNAPKFRLVRFDPEQQRLSNLEWTGGVQASNQFSDGYPLLVLSEASLEGLNTRLLADGKEAVGFDRFRPNIVLKGLPAHDEDRLGPLDIKTETGWAQIKPVKPCPRCPIPNIDPATGKSSPAVGDALQAYRSDARVQGKLTFGMNTIVLAGVDQVLRVGQTVVGDFVFGAE